MLVLIFVVSLLILATSRILKLRNFWKTRNVVHNKPLPMVGNHLQFTLGLKPFAIVVQEWYEEFKDKRFNGIFLNNQPALLLRDSQLIAECCSLEDQGYIHANPTIKNDDPNAKLTSPNLTGLINETNKSNVDLDLNLIYEWVDRSSKHFVEYFLSKGNSATAIDAEHMVERYVADTLRSLLHKEELNLFHKRNDKEFRVIGDGLRMNGDEINNLTGLREIVKNKISNPKKDSELRKTVKQLLGENNNEILQQLGAQSSGEEYVVTLLGKVFQNVVATTSFLTYELTVNTNLCTQLHREVDNACSNGKSQITMEDMSKMIYLDSIFKETLRKWPVSVIDAKKCTKDLEIGCNDDKNESLTLDKKSLVVIPTYALHRDANHFPDPEQFEPFRNESKCVNVYRTLGNNKTCAMMSILLTKVFMVNMMKQFSLVPISKTRIPIELSTRSCKLESKHGIWVGLQRRRRVSTIKNEVYY